MVWYSHVSEWQRRGFSESTEDICGPYEYDDDTRPGERGLLRYTAGVYVQGMEHQPDYYNGKTKPLPTTVCSRCGASCRKTSSKKAVLCIACARQKQSEAAKFAGLGRTNREVKT